MLATVHFALAAALALVAPACSSSDDKTPALPPPPPPTQLGYRIVYDTVVRAGDALASRRELSVRRPYVSSDLTFATGATAPDGGLVAPETKQYAVQSDKVLDFGGRALGAPPNDFRVDRVLADLRRLRLVRAVGGRKTVAGQTCRTWRFGAPLGDPITPIGSEEYTDLCIDRRGHILSERWIREGKLLREMTAVSVDNDAPPADRFQPPPGPIQQSPLQYGILEPLPKTKNPVPDKAYWRAARPPWNFRLVSRARVSTTTVGAGGRQLADLAYVDTYVRGRDAIQVTHREAAPPTDTMETVTAGGLGAGGVTVTLTGVSIIFRPPGWTVTVSGPLDVARLRAFAATLNPSGSTGAGE